MNWARVRKAITGMSRGECDTRQRASALIEEAKFLVGDPRTFGQAALACEDAARILRGQA